MFNLRLVYLLSDLSMYAPGRKTLNDAKKTNKFSVFASLRNRTNQRTSQTINIDHVEQLKKEAGLSKHRDSAPKVMSTISPTESRQTSTLSPTQAGALKHHLQKFSSALIEKFGKVSAAFRAFDLRTRGKVAFSDFAYVTDQMQLGFNRNTIMQIFTYMDFDKDSLLKYKDFCNLCAERGQDLTAKAKEPTLNG